MGDLVMMAVAAVLGIPVALLLFYAFFRLALLAWKNTFNPKG